jgi:hypothetical protein
LKSKFIFAVANLVGLCCAALGSIFLVYALELTPSPYRLIKGSGNTVIICLDDRQIVAGYGGELGPSSDKCPAIKGTGPAPQIVANHSGLASWGLWLVIAGFVCQVPAACDAIRI